MLKAKYNRRLLVNAVLVNQIQTLPLALERAGAKNYQLHDKVFSRAFHKIEQNPLFRLVMESTEQQNLGRKTIKSWRDSAELLKSHHRHYQMTTVLCQCTLSSRRFWILKKVCSSLLVSQAPIVFVSLSVRTIFDFYAGRWQSVFDTKAAKKRAGTGLEGIPFPLLELSQ